MYNHWLNAVKKKAMFNAIENAFFDVWSNDGNLTDVFSKLTKEEADMLLKMPIRDFASDPDDLEMTFELKVN